jgi:hypothetical protein
VQSHISTKTTITLQPGSRDRYLVDAGAYPLSQISSIASSARSKFSKIVFFSTAPLHAHWTVSLLQDLTHWLAHRSGTPLQQRNSRPTSAEDMMLQRPTFALANTKVLMSPARLTLPLAALFPPTLTLTPPRPCVCGERGKVGRPGSTGHQ